MGPQLVTGRPVVGPGDDAMLAAHISRLTGAGHVHRFQHLGAGLTQVELEIDGIARLIAATGQSHVLVTDVRRLDKLIQPDLIVRHIEPGAVVIEDHQRRVGAPLPVAVAGVPHLLAELFNLDVWQPGWELFGVELERDPQPGDALTDHVGSPVGAIRQHEGIAGLPIGMQLVADQAAERAHQVITDP